MTDIVFISPPSRSDNHYRPPLSLVYLAGYLNHRGMKARVIDRCNYRDLMKNLNMQYTKSIGISCMSCEFDEVKDLIHDIRQMNPDWKIYVGGIHATLKPDDFADLADGVIIGEGEVAIYEMLKDGLTGKILGKQHPLDEISYPDYSLINMDHYSMPNPYVIRGVFISAAYVHAARGCPSSCTFCVAKNLRPYFGYGRLRSPHKIWIEAWFLKERYKVDAFYIPDDLFTLNKKYILDFCALNNGIPWACSAKVTTLDEETIRAMAAANCIQIDFGVERGSDQAFKIVNKGQTVAKVVEVFDLCRKYGIRTYANFLVNIPGESHLDRTHILELIKRIKPSVVSMNVFYSQIGTDLQAPPPDEWIIAWATRKNKELNSVLSALIYHLKWRYLRIFLKSERKLSYFKQLRSLIREAFIYV